MKKSNVIVGLLIAVAIALTAGSVTYAAIVDDCGYDEKGYFHKNGKVHAMGSMNDAKACAEKGLLPQSVLNRLGVWGDAATKKEAEAIKDLDAKVKAEKEAADKAKAAESK